jgi:hypothetical protein
MTDHDVDQAAPAHEHERDLLDAYLLPAPAGFDRPLYAA